MRPPPIDKLVGLPNGHGPSALAQLWLKSSREGQLLSVAKSAVETSPHVDVRIVTALTGLGAAHKAACQGNYSEYGKQI